MAASVSELWGDRRVRVEIADATLARGRGLEPVIEAVDLTLAAGECCVLVGPTGSGKSTLLRALAGLPGVELRSGRVETASTPVLLLQNIETQLLCPTVGEEVAFGLRLRQRAPREIASRVARALEDVRLAGFEARETDTLSLGQKQRVALAALLALEPEILLLDEPFSSLDAPSRGALVDVLGELKRRGTTILVVEHAVAELEPIADRIRAISGSHGACAAGAAARPLATGGDRLAEPRSLASLATLSAGERVLITGPNGVGKSLALRTLAREHARHGHVALVGQEPRRALFGRCVRDEIAFSLDRAGVATGRRDARVLQLLERFELEGLEDRSPRRLSHGQQHQLAFASALAAWPTLVFLDEPFAGLDPRARERLLHWIDVEQRESDFALILASHDRQPLASVCSGVVTLESEGGAS